MGNGEAWQKARSSPDRTWFLLCSFTLQSVFPPPDPENLQTGTFASSPVTAIPVQATVSFEHVTATVTGTVVLDMTAETLTGTVSVTVVNSTTGTTVFLKIFTVSMVFGSGMSVKFVLFLPVGSHAVGLVCSVSLSSNQASCFLVRDPDMMRTGRVNIVDVSVVFIDFNQILGSPSYNRAADLEGTGMVNILDVSIVIGAFNAPVFS